MNKEKILDKARKLKALSCSSNEHEASLALQLMQLILAKHGLSERDLTVDEFGRFYFEYNGQPWARYIVAAISKLYFCKLAYTPLPRSAKARYGIIGSDLNCSVVHEFCIPILDNVHYWARQYGNTSAEITSFRVGSAVKISERCDMLIKVAGERGIDDDDQGDSEGVGLALIVGDYYAQNDSRIDQWIRDNMGSVRSAKNRSVRLEPRSFGKGMKHGETIELRRIVK